MVYNVYMNEKCSKLKNPVGYKIRHLATFKKKYSVIPEIMLSKGIPTTQKIWVLAMRFCDNGYRTSFVCVFKGTLLEWFQKQFLPHFKYNEQWYYLGMRRGAKIKRGYNKAGKYKLAEPIKQRETNLHFQKEDVEEPKQVEQNRYTELDYFIDHF